MRVSNIDYPRPRPATLGQYGPYQTTYTTTREAAFRLIDEDGYHVVNEGKKFPFQINDVVAADGTPLIPGPITDTALSGEDSVVRIPIKINQGAGQIPIGDQPVDATLSLWKVYNNVQYPIFQNRRLRFTVPPASPLPLDLQTIYDSYEADAYAAETARQDQIMADQYAAMIKTEEADAAKRASEAKAAAAAADAAAKRKAAADAVEAATNAASVRNKKILLTIGGAAALGLLAYFAFKGH